MIVQFALWLAASAVVVHILMWFMFALFVDLRREQGSRRVPARERAGSAPAGRPATAAEAGERDLRLPPAGDRSPRRIQLGGQGRGHGADSDLGGDAADGRARTPVAAGGCGRRHRVDAVSARADRCERRPADGKKKARPCKLNANSKCTCSRRVVARGSCCSAFCFAFCIAGSVPSSSPACPARWGSPAASSRRTCRRRFRT